MEHEYNKLKILVEKTKNELEYLNNEKDRQSGGNYSGKIQSFQRAIQTCDKRTREMNSEL